MNILKKTYLRFFPPKEWKQFKNDWISEVKRRWGKNVKFFPYNPDWVFEVSLQRHAIINSGQFLTSDGRNRDYIEHGLFIVKGYQLHLYDGSFLPFHDKSPDTYPGGRYLDLKKRKDKDIYTVDFNYAYTPLCAYSDRFSCPMVPDNNTIGVDVKAGMKRP